MHGGSGVSEDDYREVIKRGVRKINYYTYMAKAGAQDPLPRYLNGCRKGNERKRKTRHGSLCGKIKSISAPLLRGTDFFCGKSLANTRDI